MKILKDGSVENQTFSGNDYKGEYPKPIKGETYAKYRERVTQAKNNGFHLGDLSFDDYKCYCKGSGNYDGVDSNDTIK